MTSPLIETRDLTRTFTVGSGNYGPRQLLTAVSDVNLCLQGSETLGIAGESGCGKSTLARLLMGLLSPSAGEVRFKGTPLAAMSSHELSAFRQSVQIVFQDPYSSLNPRMRIGEIIGEPLLIHKLAKGNSLHERVAEIMDQVGLSPDHAARYPHEFSGGQRQRIGIARALAVNPRVVIADEPVSALDLSIQAQIINLLLELKRSRNLSFVFIAHDLSVVRHISDRIAIMYLGKIVESGSRDAVFSAFLHPYTESLLSAVPQINKSGRHTRVRLSGDVPSPLVRQPGCPFSSRCPHSRELCRQAPPPLEEKEPGHLAACHFSRELYR
jgi:peptide/nickel transport system ATP-binding protein